MIRPFKCPDTEALTKGVRVRRFVNITTVARRKLRQIEIAGRLDDLRVPPGNRLEVLKGNRAGQYSIRINDRWREAADAFEREMAALGQSEKFMAFLAERSKEPGVVSLDDLGRKLAQAED